MRQQTLTILKEIEGNIRGKSKSLNQLGETSVLLIEVGSVVEGDEKENG